MTIYHQLAPHRSGGAARRPSVSGDHGVLCAVRRSHQHRLVWLLGRPVRCIVALVNQLCMTDTSKLWNNRLKMETVGLVFVGKCTSGGLVLVSVYLELNELRRQRNQTTRLCGQKPYHSAFSSFGLFCIGVGVCAVVG